MTIKPHNPNEIYRKINDELTILIHSMCEQSSDEIINKAGSDARNKLEQFQEVLKKDLDSLQKNAEWNIFTIAFYGETGAGKSTLIETLRILLRESKKLENQKKYRQQYANYQYCSDDIEKTKNSIDEIKHNAEKITSKINELNDFHAQERYDIQQLIKESDIEFLPQLNEIKNQLEQKERINTQILQQIDDINIQISEYKKKASLWQKFLLFFNKLPEEITLSNLEKQVILTGIECKTIHQQYNSRKLLIKEKQKPLYSKLANLNERLEQEKQQFEDQLQFLKNEGISLTKKNEQLETLLEKQHALLSQYADGEIIGDGRADFTRETQCYNLTLNGNVFSLLDVPGIEGKEELVLKEIENAIERAHAVFYITNKAAPPQTGDEGRKGTLEKIKQHLNSQTEVWSIFNKKVTNPKLTLKNRPLLSDDESSSLSVLDEKMSEQLGSHYKKTIALTALPAFLASTDCLVPHSQNAKRRTKFLQDFMEYDLLELTGILDFINLLEKELLPDSQNKIYQANLNKAKEALNKTTKGLDDVEKTYQDLADDVSVKCEESKILLDSSFRIMQTRLNSNIANLIRDAIHDIRTNVYSRIEDNISNDHFKGILEQKVKAELSKLSASLPHTIKQQIEHFQTEASDIFQRYEEQTQDLMHLTEKLNKAKLDNDINIKINIDSGINKAGLLGALAGLALIPITGGASAWIIAASAFTAIVSIGKAVVGFLSSNYKMSQQKKSTNENLRKIESHLTETLNDNLAQVLPKMKDSIKTIKQSLDEPIIKMNQTAVLLKNSNQKLKILSRSIQTEGNL
ncbi:SMC family protein [Proteus terrae]|uniref:DUF726 domain-containing protein n=2 Tax=Proteus terrae TaxID=1574161 RepID=A0A8I0WRP8_9GAMM|nr:hypothetical protein [Proteus terrae]MBG2914530.1 DUF726 domain-containing protein [Proteus terrae subsp. cibarius]